MKFEMNVMLLVTAKRADIQGMKLLVYIKGRTQVKNLSEHGGEAKNKWHKTGENHIITYLVFTPRQILLALSM
jgi:hypothetical protein